MKSFILGRSRNVSSEKNFESRVYIFLSELLSELPQGYTETIRDVYEAAVSVVYESPSGSMICLDYTYMQQGAANIIAPGDDEILDVTVNGIQGQFFLPHDPADAKTITWIDADSNLQFVVKAFCSETDIPCSKKASGK